MSQATQISPTEAPLKDTGNGTNTGKSSHAALWAAITAFSIWGISPLYWNLVHGVAPQEIIAHRVLWSFVFLIPVLTYTRMWPEIMAALRTPSIALRCCFSGLLLLGNWNIYVWAVTSGYVLEYSLGYYINPLLSVAVGALFFRERPSRLQICAIILAALGVLIMVIGYGRVPWVSLTLGSSFLLYGIMRKTIKVSSLVGFFIEMSILAPFVLAWLVWQEYQGIGSFGHIPPMQNLVLVFSGLITCVPFLCFGYAARNLRLMSLGLLQYIEPTLAFILGVFIFHETTSIIHICTFSCIWVALAIYSYDSWRVLRHINPR